MSGYIEAGYVIVLGSLSVYAVTLVARERALTRRTPPPEAAPKDSPDG